MKVVSFRLSCIQDGNKLSINSLGKPCGGGSKNKTVFFFFFFFFLSFFLHTWLYLLMTPALIMHVIPGLPSYNGVKVYYLKGVIELPIVISFRDRWYIHFFFWKWAHWWRHRHRLDRFRFQNFQSPASLAKHDMPCLSKQCRSRSVGFWRSQLIWICTVCH